MSATPRRARPSVWVAAFAVLIAAGAMSACTFDGPEPTSPAPTSLASETARPPETSPPATPSTSPAVYGDLGDTSPVEDGFPQRLSSLVGVDVRTGSHAPCFERVVVELDGSGDPPGYRVAYVADPVLDSPRGEPVEIAGEATLVLSMGSWMPSPDGGGYDGPSEIVPDNVTTILELQRIENFEGMSSWAIGLDRERDFTVSTLDDPARIVVDIALGGASG